MIRRSFGRPRQLGTASAAGLALFAAGCAVGPDFERPAAPADAGYSAAPLPAKTVAADVAGGAAQEFREGDDVKGDWWRLYRSPALDRLIADALAHNPDLDQARATLLQARENTIAAAGAFYPSVSGSLSGTRERISGASFGEPGLAEIYNLYGASVSVSYTPDIFGGTRRQVESLAAAAEYQGFELQAAWLSLTANLVTAAVQEASIRGQIAATEDILKAEGTELDVVRSQFTLGGASKADVLAQQSTLEATEATLPALRNQLAQAQNQLTAYAGHLPNEAGDAVFDLDALELPVALPVSLPSQLVEQRPDLRAAEAQLHEASANVGVAVANMLPQISLTGSLGGSSLEAGQLFSGANSVWSLGAGITQPIFEGGKLLHQRRAADAALAAAAAAYRSAVVKAFQDVSNALHALDEDAATLAAELAAARSAGDSLAIARLQYEAGATNYLTLLNAERTYAQARLTLVQARAGRYADTAALFQALGGGWWHGTEAAAAAEAPKS